MKPLFIVSLLSLFSTYSFGQDGAVADAAPKLSKNYLYLSPFNLISSQFLVGYERDFGRKHSLAFLPGIIVDDGDYYSSGINFGFTADLQYRYHIVSVSNPREKAKNPFRFDFYAGPFVAYSYLDFYGDYAYYDSSGGYSYTNDSAIINSVSGGILFGTRFTFFERFAVDVYGGGGVKYSDQDATYSYYGVYRPGYTGIIGKVNLQIGVAF